MPQEKGINTGSWSSNSFHWNPKGRIDTMSILKKKPKRHEHSFKNSKSFHLKGKEKWHRSSFSRPNENDKKNEGNLEWFCIVGSNRAKKRNWWSLCSWFWCLFLTLLHLSAPKLSEQPSQPFTVWIRSTWGENQWSQTANRVCRHLAAARLPRSQPKHH